MGGGNLGDDSLTTEGVQMAVTAHAMELKRKADILKARAIKPLPPLYKPKQFVPPKPKRTTPIKCPQRDSCVTCTETVGCGWCGEAEGDKGHCVSGLNDGGVGKDNDKCGLDETNYVFNPMHCASEHGKVGAVVAIADQIR